MNKCRRAVMVLLCIMSGCSNGDYEKPLPNGYALASTNADTTAIFVKSGKMHRSHPTNGIAVTAKIDRIAVFGNWVVGHVVTSPQSEVYEFEKPGYFILDTLSGQTLSGLTEKDWTDQLTRQGITSQVNLRTPRSL